MRVHGSLAATGKGELSISASPSSRDNWLHHIEVKLRDIAGDYLSLGGTFDVDEAPAIVAQLREVADAIEAWDAGRSARPVATEPVPVP